MKKSALAFAGLALLAGTLAGSTALAKSASPSGYVFYNGTEAAIVKLTIYGGSVTGTFAEVRPAAINKIIGQGGTLTSVNYGVYGEKSGSSVTLTIREGYYKTQQVSGTLARNGLTLYLPTADGSLEPFLFKPGSVAQYNSDVKILKRNIDKGNQLADEENNLDSAALAFRNDSDSISADIANLKADMKAAASGAPTLQADFQTLQHDSSKISQDYQVYNSCQSQLNQAEQTLQKDGQTLMMEQNSPQAAGQGVGSSGQSTQQFEQTLQQEQQTVNQDQQAVNQLQQTATQDFQSVHKDMTQFSNDYGNLVIQYTGDGGQNPDQASASVSSLPDDINSAKLDLKDYKSGYAKMVAAEKKVPFYNYKNDIPGAIAPPSAAKEKAFVASVQSDIKAGTEAYSEYGTQAESLYQQAQRLSQTVQAQYPSNQFE